MRLDWDSEILSWPHPRAPNNEGIYFMTQQTVSGVLFTWKVVGFLSPRIINGSFSLWLWEVRQVQRGTIKHPETLWNQTNQRHRLQKPMKTLAKKKRKRKPHKNPCEPLTEAPAYSPTKPCTALVLRLSPPLQGQRTSKRNSSSKPKSKNKSPSLGVPSLGLTV